MKTEPEPRAAASALSLGARFGSGHYARIADMPVVTLRYWAAAKDAAGVADEKVEALTLADALAVAGLQARRQAGSFASVLARSSFLVDGQPAGLRPPESIRLSDDAVIEVLPPFAGG
jgi:molybdopterin converting factor small subunit